MQLIGEWIKSDTLKDLVYTVEAFAPAGATATLEGKRASDRGLAINIVAATFTANGADADATFENVGDPSGLALESGRDVFECRVKVVKGGETGWTEPFQLAIRRWP